MPLPDVVIAGAGLVGLACALECERRGLHVTVLERGHAAREASWAAAGMLAAHDPGNPAALGPLSELSLMLYPAFLDAVRRQSGMDVPIETEWVLERDPSRIDPRVESWNKVSGFAGTGFHFRREQSLDPRKLASAALGAAQTSTITLRENTSVESVRSSSRSALVHTPRESVACGAYLDCTGAWSVGRTRPAKGQMMRVHAPGVLAVAGKGSVVVRTDDVYMVPRLDGSVVIGATVEDAGFDTAVHDDDVNALRQRASSLVPPLADAAILETWAGLRPDTPDHLPFLGATGERTFVAAGHFRNGVLLAPATARVMTQVLLGEVPDADLSAFDPHRFAAAACAPEHGIQGPGMTTAHASAYNRAL